MFLIQWSHTKKTQGVSLNLFVLCRKYLDFVSWAFRTLRTFPTVLALDFNINQLLLSQGNKFGYSESA